MGPAFPCVRARTSLIMQRDTQQRKTKLHNRQPTALPYSWFDPLHAADHKHKHKTRSPHYCLWTPIRIFHCSNGSSCYDDYYYKYFYYYYYFVAFTARDFFVLRGGALLIKFKKENIYQTLRLQCVQCPTQCDTTTITATATTKQHQLQYCYY